MAQQYIHLYERLRVPDAMNGNLLPKYSPISAPVNLIGPGAERILLDDREPGEAANRAGLYSEKVAAHD